ncbi:MFS transporter [Salinibacter ruber]|uniref:MFS family permease n=1 Tax=Salinibacter ruber TaxID=146919 RepID=A0A9X2U1V1_9BACT|nr:MFS transporter [Salinibacter ruber]MCS3858658.1 MFS family permease [Salinibacter ruber]MCS3865663.1 MFS family permease [Salinibacter ruber]MCS4151067.1 MFS family permease [Salinibacter ruber]
MDDRTSSGGQLFGVDRRVLALALARMADAVGNSFLIIVLPLYVASEAVGGRIFGVPASMVAGVVLALFGIASSIAQPLAGRLSDRAGRRKIFVIGGLVVLGAINLAFAAATAYWHLFVLRVVQGLAAAFTITASLAIVNELSDAGSRGGNMGVYNSFRLIGFGAGPLLASVLLEMGPFTMPGGAEVTGFEATFAVAAATAFLGTGLVGVLVQDPEGTAPTERRLALRVWDRSGSGWRLDTIFALGVATLIMASCMALLSAIEPEVNARLGQGPFLFAVEFVALIAALAALQPVVGRTSDRMGRKWFIVLGLMGLVPTTLLQGVVGAPWQMIVVRMLQGGAGALVFAPALALAGDHTEQGQSGAQLAVLTVAFGLGISSGQLMAGFFVSFGFIVPFGIGSLLAVGAAVLVGTQVDEAEPAPSAA